MWMGVFIRTATWTLDGQAGMSMQGDSPEYEYRRRVQEHEVRSNRLSCVVVRCTSGFHGCAGVRPGKIFFEYLRERKDKRDGDRNFCFDDCNSHRDHVFDGK